MGLDRIILLFFGFAFFVLDQYFFQIDTQVQFYLFGAGIIILGIPHGAVDVLVAYSTSQKDNKPFSQVRFLAAYLLRLILFGLILVFFPFIGIILFVLLSAYHFGETDLFFLQTDTIQGKILVSCYGLVILAVILLSNVTELIKLINAAGLNDSFNTALVFIEVNNTSILSFVLLLFFSSIFIYFLISGTSKAVPDYFLIQFAILVFVLYNLPLILGFTFYFVCWHSVLSLKNIITFLKNGNLFPMKTIINQILLYSSLAIGGIIITGVAGYFFINNQAIILYIFLALAVLTAPHMQIMHNMYKKIRGLV